jgi:hypothetical protein
VTVSGATVFARYAYPPNALGYCGPADASLLIPDAAPDADERIARQARQFEGAWPYLEIIADANGVADPLDARVVEAYWLGNDLLDAVDPNVLVAQLQQRFLGQAGASWTPGCPHHSFHVFAVYPWVGLLARGARNDVALSVLDQCRIRPGEVLAVDGPRVRVRSRPLVLDAGRLALGAPCEQSAAWTVDGRAMLASIRTGDTVALHWDWVCDVLTPQQTAQLIARNAAQLDRTNTASLTPQ